MNKGLIKISNELYTQHWYIIHVFMKDFRITHIEFRHLENDIWYLYGESDKFEPINEGEKIPQYDVIFTISPGSGVSYEFKRVTQ